MVGRTIKKWWPVFVLPTFAAFVIGFLWPFIWGIYLSFCKFTTVQDVTFVGFSNYSKILLDSTFSHSFWLTVVFAFVSSILINVLAFFIALALTKGYRGTNAFRTVFFMPNLIGGIVLGYIWQTLLNGLLSKWGQPLLSLSARNGFIGMLILLMWQQIGYMMIIYIAGLNNVSPDLIEAAKIDGATIIQQIRNVELPALKPVIVIQFILSAGNIMSIGFEKVYAMQTDLNKITSDIIPTYVYRLGLEMGDYGYSTAVGLFNSIVNLILLVAVNYVVSKLNEGEGL